MTEKEKIEKATAEGFLLHYNRDFSRDFKIVKMSDAPDVHCLDSQGMKLNLEITMTEDRPGDITALLGRSNHRSLEELSAHVARVARGEEQVKISNLLDNVIGQLVERIIEKMKKDYGSNIALVVQHTSGVSWDWDKEISSIRSRLRSMKNPFDKGIWLLSRSKDRLFKIT